MSNPDYTQLVDKGLNLIAVFNLQTLPATITDSLSEIKLTDYSRLVLLGNGGGEKLWAAMQHEDMSAPDPVDNFSIQQAETFVASQLGGARHTIVYPLRPYPLPLQKLGALAGWHHDSPLGLGIHSHYGVWFAYRVAFLVDAALPLRSDTQTPSPCSSCADKPCISSCPVAAVGEIGRFKINVCGKHRIAERTSCVDRCLSRLACPIGRTHRYPMAQINYHYTHSLPSMRAWYESNPI